MSPDPSRRGVGSGHDTTPTMEEAKGREIESLLKERAHLQCKLQSSRERLRKLRAVRTHCNKASLDELSALTSKWRCVAQTAADQLLASCHPGPPASMIALLTFLHIEPSLIRYCPTQETFY